MVSLANEIPGFGGMFINSANEFVAYIKDTTTQHALAASAVKALRAHLSSNGFGVPLRVRPNAVRTLPADYDWPTLSGYRDFIADSLMNPNGVVTVGIDVAINRVSVTVASSNPNAESDLKQALIRYQIPLAAISVSRGVQAQNAAALAPSAPTFPDPTSTLLTLNDSEPAALMGGIMIRVPTGPGGQTGFCSIGAVVDSAGITKLLSASHCSLVTWTLDGDSIHTFDGDLIGHETTDMAATVAWSPTWGHFWHRGSDDALWSMDATYGAGHAMPGVIGRTTSRDSSGASGALTKTLDSSNPYLYIYDTLTSSSLFVGEEVDKVGQTSGWQKGQIWKLCIDVLEANSHDHECSTEITALTMEGDSGGPVFIWDGEDGAVLVGTMWGKDKNTVTSDTSRWLAGYVSNWSAIATENGHPDPRRHTTVGAPSPTGSVSGGQGVTTWSAVSTTNTSATTQYEIYQSTWDAPTQSWTEFNQYEGSTTSLTYTDASAPWTIYSIGDGSDQCTYSYVSVVIVAYNAGVRSAGSSVWFQGPANGPPGCRDQRAPLRKPDKSP